MPEPLTPRQRTAVMIRFGELGLARLAWRDRRLAIAAVITDHPGLGSIKELTFGEAGYLLSVLRSCRDCRDLAAVVADHARVNTLAA